MTNREGSPKLWLVEGCGERGPPMLQRPNAGLTPRGRHVLAACARCPVSAWLACARRMADVACVPLVACVCDQLLLGSHALATRAAWLAHARSPCPLGLRPGGRSCAKDSAIACGWMGLREKRHQVSRFWRLFRVGERLVFSHLGFYGGLRALLCGCVRRSTHLVPFFARGRSG